MNEVIIIGEKRRLRLHRDTGRKEKTLFGLLPFSRKNKKQGHLLRVSVGSMRNEKMSVVI